MTNEDPKKYTTGIEDAILAGLLQIVAKKVMRGDIDPDKLPPDIRNLIFEEELTEEEQEDVKREVAELLGEEAEEEVSEFGELEFNPEHDNVYRLVLRPKVDAHILQLIARLLNGDVKSREKLVKILTDQNTPSVTRDYVIGVLANSLEHNYRGAEEVLTQTLYKAKGSVYTNVIKSIVNHNDYAAQYLKLARPSFQMQPPRPEPKKS